MVSTAIVTPIMVCHPLCLSRDIDSGIASQVGIGVVAGEVFFAGVFVALVIVVEVIMGSIVAHGSTFLLCRSPFGFAVVLLKVI
jgi:hypothetical protein